MHLEAVLYAAEDLQIGMAAEFERAITEADVLTFAENSGDFNPLHVDADYAATSNFQGRIVHGAFQVGLASAMIGMFLPGRNVLLGGINARFPSPLYFPCRVIVRGKIVAWNLNNLRGQLRVVVLETAQMAPVAEITIAFTFHQKRDATQLQFLPASTSSHGTDLKTVLITGASGGIGGELVAQLAQEFRILAVVNRHPLEERLRRLPSVQEIPCDLSQAGWDDVLRPSLDGYPLYSVIHAAWPGSPHGGLLQVDDDVIARQLDFGTLHSIRLARTLFQHADDRGGRFVAIGSIFGDKRPNINLAAYSLGKSALESTVRLLAPELARKAITVNAVCPSVVPAGMNKQTGDRQRKLAAARIPMGRLCSVMDVVGTVRYLLSDQAAFISGQSIGLTGGQL